MTELLLYLQVLYKNIKIICYNLFTRKIVLQFPVSFKLDIMFLTIEKTLSQALSGLKQNIGQARV